jgi:hypothetical protein
MIFNTLKFYLDQRKVSKSKAARHVGMTQAGFWRSLEKETMKAKDFIKLSKYLNIPPGELYDNTAPSKASNVMLEPPISYPRQQYPDAFEEYLKLHNDLMIKINILIDKQRE